jgi:DinB superfamily
MAAGLPADLVLLEDAFDAVERDARLLVADLPEALGTWRASEGAWSVAECLDHLAAGNTVYIGAMARPAALARERGRWRRGPATPGFVGRWFIGMLEPPVTPRFKLTAPRIIRPRSGPPLHEAFAAFLTSHAAVRAFLRENADLDLARVRFPNPFVTGVRFSLATGLHVLAAHDRRHLWQAWRVRRAAEQGATAERASSSVSPPLRLPRSR